MDSRETIAAIKKIEFLRASLIGVRRELNKAHGDICRLAILSTGQRGELLATRRELAGIRRAAADIFAGGPIGCACCDAPAVDNLRAALARKIW